MPPRKSRAGAAFQAAGNVANTQTPPDTPPLGDALTEPAPQPAPAADTSALRLVPGRPTQPDDTTALPEPQPEAPEGPASSVSVSLPVAEPAPAPATTAPAAEPAADGLTPRIRTNDAVPVRLAKKVQADKREASTVVVLAVTQAHTDGVLADLCAAYRNRGGVTTLFGGHRPAKPDRATPTTRLNYNCTQEEFTGYTDLAKQYRVSRSVLVSLCLAHFYGIENPAAIV